MARPAAQTHETFTREEVVKGSSDRSFGLTFAAIGLIVAAVSFWRGGSWWPYALAAVAVFGGLALAAPVALAPLNRLWLKFGLLLHHIINPLVMGLLFFGVITPMALIVRLLGKDLLRLRFDANAKSYWIPREPPGPAPDTMRYQF